MNDLTINLTDPDLVERILDYAESQGKDVAEFVTDVLAKALMGEEFEVYAEKASYGNSLAE